MATIGGAIGVQSFSSPSSRVFINTRTLSSALSLALPSQSFSKRDNQLRCVVLCSAVQESSASASASVSAEKKEAKGNEKEATKAEAEAATPEKKPKPAAKAEAATPEKKPKPAAKAEAATPEKKPKPAAKAEAATPEKKPKPAAKAVVKPLPQMMEEDVIPPLKSILEAQDDITGIELSFRENKLEGSFLKKGNRYSFWAFFPSGDLTGAKGFSISSYGSKASTVEPFLVDERKPTANQVVFWVEKRLAAQGFIPVWTD